MLKIAFVLLTLNTAGDPRLTVSYSETMEDCDALGFTILGILEEAGAEVLHHRCIETDLALTPFSHGLGPEHEIHRYRVTLPDAGNWDIEPLAQGAECQSAASAAGQVYCAVSVQQVTGQQ